MYIQSCRLSGPEKKGYGTTGAIGAQTLDWNLQKKIHITGVFFMDKCRGTDYRATTDLHYSIHADIVPTLMTIVSYGVLRYGCVG
jgi:hypothetical protein